MNEEEHKLEFVLLLLVRFFNETKVPVENMLAGRGEGFKIAMNALNVGRIKLAAACLDAQRRVTSNAVNYANERIQFNTPISSFGAIRYKLAEMATSLMLVKVLRIVLQKTLKTESNFVKQKVQVIKKLN
jgi:alkylation response protein AidB-like acyl-CoA dehydrogenase